MTRGEDGEVVEEGVVTVEYVIRAWQVDGETRFDWVADHGDSDELFETIEEAVQDVKTSLGGY
jgi:hypothetical protein